MKTMSADMKILELEVGYFRLPVKLTHNMWMR